MKQNNQKGYSFVLVECIDREITEVVNFATLEEANAAMADRYNHIIMSIEAQHGFDGAVDGEIDLIAGKAWVNDLNDDRHFDWAVHKAVHKAVLKEDVAEDMPAAENEPAATGVEDDQLMLDNLCKALQCTRSFGKVRDDSNYILELKLIQKENGWRDMWGKPHAGGKYVRVIWSDSPERDDGYYDVFVDGSSTWGILTSVVEYLKERA